MIFVVQQCLSSCLGDASPQDAALPWRSRAAMDPTVIPAIPVAEPQLRLADAWKGGKLN